MIVALAGFAGFTLGVAVMAGYGYSVAFLTLRRGKATDAPGAARRRKGPRNMTSRDFCYWLQGFFEISKKGWVEGLDKDQVDMIQRHLAMVFKHEIDPSMGPPEHQAALNEIHKPKSPSDASTPAYLRPQDPGGPVYRC